MREEQAQREREIPQPRGDEAALFTRHHERLRRMTALNVETSDDNIEEACAYAWYQLLRHQPRRSTLFAWLRTVARREAIRLDRLSRATVSIDISELDEAAMPLAGRGRPDEAHRLVEAREHLGVLPRREQSVAFMRAVGLRYAEIGESLGISSTRVDQLLKRADARLRDLEDVERAIQSPRAQRLHALESDPPGYLLGAIGKPPRVSPKHGGAQLQLEWRRLALAIVERR